MKFYGILLQCFMTKQTSVVSFLVFQVDEKAGRAAIYLHTVCKSSPLYCQYLHKEQVCPQSLEQ